MANIESVKLPDGTEYTIKDATAQPATLVTPLVIGGVTQTTVEGALGALNTGSSGAEKTDLTSIIATGSTNTTGAQIPNGAYFYLNGVFCRAIADIATSATFTQNTNYKEIAVGDALSQMLDINNAWPTLTQGTNWNNATKTGMYYMNTWAGSGGSNYFPVQTSGVCLVLNPGGNIIQLVFAREVYGIRTYNASNQTWGSWTKVTLY